VQAVDDVEAIVVPPERIRVLFVADAELGERILRALMLRRVALIEMGFGGPVLIGPPRSPDVTRLSGFLGRNSIPFRVFDPDEDADASSLLARYAPKPAELPIVIMPDGTVLRNPTDQELARALGLVATNLRSEPYDVAIVGAGPAGLATAVYAASEASRSSCSKRAPSADRLARARGSKTVSAFPQDFRQALMARAFTQAQKFGAQFSLSTEVNRLDCITEWSGTDPTLILELNDGRRVRARTVVVATGAHYRRPEIPNLTQFEAAEYRTGPRQSRPALPRR